MKLNWRIFVALVVLGGATFWGLDSVRTRSYSGTNLDVAVGSGPVTITNPSAEAFPVKLVGTGTRSFSVSSASSSVSGSSTRQGSGRATTQLFEFDLPSGITELMIVARGADVSFVSDTASRLDVTAQPLPARDVQTTLIVAAIAILGSLFYISRATGHRWISRFRRVDSSLQDTQPNPVAATGDPNKGRDGRMYTDV
jgi:hypothetical protein